MYLTENFNSKGAPIIKIQCTGTLPRLPYERSNKQTKIKFQQMLKKYTIAYVSFPIKVVNLSVNNFKIKCLTFIVYLLFINNDILQLIIQTQTNRSYCVDNSESIVIRIIITAECMYDKKFFSVFAAINKTCCLL